MERTAVAEQGQPQRHQVCCISRRRREVIAAISYHIASDEHAPVLITAIALRRDAQHDPVLGGETVYAAVLLKEYVHAIGWCDGRGKAVETVVRADASVLTTLTGDLGFRRIRRSGTAILLSQSPAIDPPPPRDCCNTDRPPRP